MKPLSSSTLRLFTEHCPAALGYQEANALYMGQWDTAAGKAAHAVLQMVGLATKDMGKPPPPETVDDIAARTCLSLIKDGREFRGTHEPPLNPDSVYLGRDIAMRWLREHTLSPTAEYEIELGTKCGNYVAIFDEHEAFTDGDEESEFTVASSTDYKTAWPTDASELDKLQFRGHAVILRDNFPDADEIRIAALNLRTWKRFERCLDMHNEDDVALIETWRRDILDTVKAARETREHRPGYGCIGCPFGFSCSEVWSASTLIDDEAAHYGPLKSELSRAEALLREATKEKPFTVGAGEEGFEIGYFEHERKVPNDNAYKKIAYEAFDVPLEQLAEFDAQNAKWLGLLKGLKLSATNLDAFTVWMYPKDRSKENAEARAYLIDALTTTEKYPRFAVRRLGKNSK